MATLGDLVTRALHDDFQRTKFESTAIEAINDALSRIYRTTRIQAADVTDSVTLAAGDNSALMDGTFLRMGRVWIDGKHELDWMSRDELTASLDGAERGTPTHYTIEGTYPTAVNLVVAPVPDVSTTIEFTAQWGHTRLTSTGETVPLPDDFAYYPVRFARAELFAYTEDFASSAEWERRWIDGLREIRAHYANENRDTQRSRVMPSMWSSLGAGLPSFRRPGE
jgi:hypothetical protein